MSGLQPGLNPHLKKIRALEPLEQHEVSKPIRVRTDKATFERVKALSPKQVGEALKRGLEPE